MGQYYRAVILSESDEIIAWFLAYDYGSGVKMMEHAYIGDLFVLAVENYIHGKGLRVVWAGDYDTCDDGQENLYKRCDALPELRVINQDTSDSYGYIVNRSKKMFIDKVKSLTLTETDLYWIHPLPLLTSKTNGGGGGDYRGDNELDVGIWAGDVIDVAGEHPGDEYTEYVSSFREDS
jgi:hypothetical protein